MELETLHLASRPYATELNTQPTLAIPILRINICMKENIGALHWLRTMQFSPLLACREVLKQSNESASVGKRLRKHAM